MKQMLEKKLAELNGKRMSGEKVVVHEPAAIEIAKRHSPKDFALWIFAFVALISATLVNQYLPAYWQPASSLWTRVAVIAGLIIAALLALALTNQGSAFKTLLQDSRVELRRVTWPSKQETLEYTWQVAVVAAILAFIVWLLDTVFSQLIQYAIGQ
ncbi:preprotein translocase subunit SecE [Moraxella osloensis]|nr:preprotein translocase subunit SecE [Moraxella osloensis]MDK1669613.1 preprotein translocase subunit SecE [Moraxella osloensis]